MSQDNTNDQIPEGDVLQSEQGQRGRARGKGIPPAVKFGGLIAGVLLVIGTTVAVSSKQEAEPSVTPRVATIDSTPGGEEQQNSPLYRESISSLNQRRAELAAEYNVSSVPTPENFMEPLEPQREVNIIDMQDDAPAEIQPQAQESAVTKPVERRSMPKPIAIAPRDEPQRSPVVAEPTAPANGGGTGEAPENPYIQRMSTQMGVMATAFAAKEMTAAEVTDPNADGVDGSSSQANQQLADASGEAPSVPAELMMRPGDILYAETMTTVQSDMNSPVMAEIVSGEFKGARLTGSFEADKTAGRMVVEFNRMTLTDDTVIDITAFAVDGATAETAVASDVERRYIARYAPIVAASFITGFAQSASQRAETVVGTGDNQQIVSDIPSNKQNLYAGLGAAVGTISQDIMENVPKGPKVILRSGYPIGILIVEPVEKP